MAIEVTNDNGTTRHDTANKWHVDDNGYLHLRSDSGPTATYNNISWHSVERAPEPVVDNSGPSAPAIKAWEPGAGVVKAAVARVNATTSVYNIGTQ